MSVLVWIHEDSLSPFDPALAAHPDVPAVFVWDDAAIEAEGYSLKRIVFLYECLLAMPVQIYRGPTVETLSALAARQGAKTICTTASVNPRFAETVLALQRSMQVELVPPQEFIPQKLEADLRRFARFWKRAETHAFRRTER